MEIGLTNAKLSVGKTQELQTQKVTPARTSIAEDAIFIPKPHKRVEFKSVSTQETKVTPEDLKLPGSGSNSEKGTDGKNIQLGSLGKHGLTAEMDATAYQGSSTPRTEMVINKVPEKDFGVITGQEEGRQTNHASSTHYSQQYDAYGRPRIGFSREPYDFAATKYIVKSSEIRLKHNSAQSKEAFAYADQRFNKQTPADIENREMFLGAAEEMDKKLEEAKSPVVLGSKEKSEIGPKETLSKNEKENEVISNLPAQNKKEFVPIGTTDGKELEEKTGVDFTKLITNNRNQTNQNDASDHTRDKNRPSISLKI